MREIKFRAWDKNLKEMVEFTIPLWSEFWGVNAFEFDSYEIMQYTGLKDKNGKEIYEGDIVKTKYQQKAKVVWLDKDACFATETIDEIVKEEYQFCLGDIEEIIGNIYEGLHSGEKTDIVGK